MNKQQLLPLLKHRCQWCNTPFNGDERPGKVIKYCSLDCYHKAKQPPEWAWLAVSISVFLDYGCRRTAQLLGVPKPKVMQVWHRFNLKRDGRSSANPPEIVERMHGDARLNNALRQAWKEEWRGAVKYDECRHWYKRREYTNYVSKLIARRQYRKWKFDPQKRVLRIMRARMWKVIHRQYGIKQGRTMELLGCTADEFRRHIESQFTSDMTWENHGAVWEVDHIRPCASFDLTTEDGQRECFNWRNTRPMITEDNRLKRAWWNGQQHWHVARLRNRSYARHSGVPICAPGPYLYALPEFS